MYFSDKAQVSQNLMEIPSASLRLWCAGRFFQGLAELRERQDVTPSASESSLTLFRAGIRIVPLRATSPKHVSPLQLATSADPPPLLRNEPAIGKGMSNEKVQGGRFKVQRETLSRYFLLPNNYLLAAPPRNIES